MGKPNKQNSRRRKIIVIVSIVLLVVIIVIVLIDALRLREQDRLDRIERETQSLHASNNSIIDLDKFFYFKDSEFYDEVNGKEWSRITVGASSRPGKGSNTPPRSSYPELRPVDTATKAVDIVVQFDDASLDYGRNDESSVPRGSTIAVEGGYLVYMQKTNYAPGDCTSGGSEAVYHVTREGTVEKLDSVSSSKMICN